MNENPASEESGATDGSAYGPAMHSAQSHLISDLQVTLLILQCDKAQIRDRPGELAQRPCRREVLCILCILQPWRAADLWHQWRGASRPLERPGPWTCRRWSGGRLVGGGKKKQTETLNPNLEEPSKVSRYRYAARRDRPGRQVARRRDASAAIGRAAGQHRS